MRRGLIALAFFVSACSADPVSPLPIDVPIASAPPSSAPAPAPSSVTATSPSPSRTPTIVRPSKPRTKAPRPSVTTTRPRSCLGAVRYDIDLAQTEQLPRSLCFGAGAVLRLIGIGPGEVSIDRPDLASSNYEAGVVDIRFLRAGTVAVTIPRTAEPETITVVVQ